MLFSRNDLFALVDRSMPFSCNDPFALVPFSCVNKVNNPHSKESHLVGNVHVVSHVFALRHVLRHFHYLGVFRWVGCSCEHGACGQVHLRPDGGGCGVPLSNGMVYLLRAAHHRAWNYGGQPRVRPSAPTLVFSGSVSVSVIIVSVGFSI
jgi:hypothetical protein